VNGSSHERNLSDSANSASLNDAEFFKNKHYDQAQDSQSDQSTEIEPHSTAEYRSTTELHATTPPTVLKLHS
jgi:hypothetical protein